MLYAQQIGGREGRPRVACGVQHPSVLSVLKVLNRIACSVDEGDRTNWCGQRYAHIHRLIAARGKHSNYDLMLADGETY